MVCCKFYFLFIKLKIAAVSAWNFWKPLEYYNALSLSTGYEEVSLYKAFKVYKVFKYLKIFDIFFNLFTNVTNLHINKYKVKSATLQKFALKNMHNK